jgi:fluoroacetyl-CoA thioesterase
MPPTVGLQASVRHVVGADDTATSLGSGDLEVLATPRLLAWAEEATVRAIAQALGPGETSVGTRVELEHVAPSGLGAAVDVSAGVVQVDGRLVRFDVAAMDSAGRLIGHGTVTRVVVDRGRFMARLES